MTNHKDLCRMYRQMTGTTIHHISGPELPSLPDAQRMAAGYQVSRTKTYKFMGR